MYPSPLPEIQESEKYPDDMVRSRQFLYTKVSSPQLTLYAPCPDTPVFQFSQNFQQSSASDAGSGLHYQMSSEPQLTMYTPRPSTPVVQIPQDVQQSYASDATIGLHYQISSEPQLTLHTPRPSTPEVQIPRDVLEKSASDTEIGLRYQMSMYAQCARGNHQVQRKYGPCGIITSVLLFPFGLIALYYDVERSCSTCGVKLE